MSTIKATMRCGDQEWSWTVEEPREMLASDLGLSPESDPLPPMVEVEPA